MKALWFSHVPSILPYSGGSVFCGWIGGLLKAVCSVPDLELGVAAFSDSGDVAISRNGITYFGLNHDTSLRGKCVRLFDVSARDGSDVEACLRVVRQFQPDIIHVFGTEGPAGLLSERTNVPVLIYLQGLLGPSLNAWLPPFYSVCDLLARTGRSPLRLARQWHAWRYNRHAAAREREILRNGRFFLGRTEWDRTYVSLYAPQARYFRCEEVLRPEFSEPADRHPSGKPLFVSTLSGPLYKGHDVVLKTAKVLRETGHDNFEWRVFGVEDFRFAEKKTGVRSGDVHVRAMGCVPAPVLRDELLSCTAYVHPSYIDNSPNGVCEAQVLGVPVVATNVGGVSSIVAEGKTGFLVPANDPVALARRMIDLATGALRLPDDWESGPRSRHDSARIAERVLGIYREISEESVPSRDRRGPT